MATVCTDMIYINVAKLEVTLKTNNTDRFVIFWKQGTFSCRIFQSMVYDYTINL